MSTTIAPSTGQGALFMQAGPGASPGYGAIDDRRAFGCGLQEGVMDVHSFEVTQKASGANLSVDIAANIPDALGSGISAIIQGDTLALTQGLYYCPPHSAVINEAITTANGTNPRVDRVVLEVRDTTVDSSGANEIRTRVITGTASSGATLDNLTGAAAVPVNCLLLADVLVPASDTTISNNQIRDRRKWARGAYCISSITSNKTSTSASLALADSTNLNPRIECSGAPLRVALHAGWLANGTTKGILVDVFVDGATTNTYDDTSAATSKDQALDVTWTFTPSAGSHKIGLAFASIDSPSQVQLSADPTGPLTWVIEEIIRPSTANNVTTTG